MRALWRVETLRRHVASSLEQQQHRCLYTKRCLSRKDPKPHTIRELRHGDLLFVSEPLNMRLSLDKAINAVGQKTIEWLTQQGVEIPNKDIAEHVAMAIGDSTGHVSSVVEAVRLVGVRTLPLEAFFGEFMPGTKFYHGQFQSTTRDQAQRAVSFATARLGAPYAEDFAPPDPLCEHPWLQAYYCSSLIDYAYRDALKEELVFTQKDFPLIWEPEAFWEKFYKKLGMKRHCGIGSNPTLLLHSPRIKYALLRTVPKKEEVHELF